MSALNHFDYLTTGYLKSITDKEAGEAFNVVAGADITATTTYSDRYDVVLGS
jgi:hypothetical protein